MRTLILLLGAVVSLSVCGEPQGRVEPHDELGIEVYLPAGYDASKRHFPVAIVHGGASAQPRGKLIDAVDRLGGIRVDPVILVFVETVAGDHDAYARTIAEELIPFVDASYRTIASREGRAHIGAGPAGFTAFYCAFKRPGAARKIGTHSATRLDTLEPLIPSARETMFDVYLDWGPDDGAEANRRLAGRLVEHGYDVQGGEPSEDIGDLLAALFPARRTRAGR